MKKYFVIFTMIGLLFCLIIMGCNTKENSSSNSNEDKAIKESSVKLTISAAASLKEVMNELTEEFKKTNSNISIDVNFGSSGSLQQQIEQGAPADIFISAGQKQMNSLNEKGLLLDSTQKDLLKNELVLIGLKDTTITEINDIKNDKVKKIAIGEPTSVPAGKYAYETLSKLEINEKVQSKLVFAKDVKEVLAWCTYGNVDVGFVYLSDILSNDSVKIIEKINENMHSPIIYPVSVIKSSKNPNEAKQFEDFLFTDKVKHIFEKYGYKSI